MHNWIILKECKHSMNKVGIVILNYVNWEVTVKCIKSIIESRITVPYTILVIDNGSNNNSIDCIKKNVVSVQNNVVYLQLENNIGFARGNNIGIQWCEENNIDYCLLINSDIIVSADCLDVLFDVFRKKDDAIIVGPQILDRDYNLTESSLMEKTRIIDALGIFKCFKPKRINERDKNITEPVYSISGCCFMVDVVRFIELGMFDSNTFLYNEENILAEKVQRSYYREYFTSETYVVHEHAASSGGKKDFVYIELLKSTLYYWKQYRGYNRGALMLFLYAWLFKMQIIKLKGNNIHPLKIVRNGKQYLRELYK